MGGGDGAGLSVVEALVFEGGLVVGAVGEHDVGVAGEVDYGVAGFGVAGDDYGFAGCGVDAVGEGF